MKSTLLAMALTLLGSFAFAQQRTTFLPIENFIKVEGGTFMMGSPEGEWGRDEDEMQHIVTVGSFYISKYEITQKEYQTIMGTNPSYFKGDNLPVENINWYNAIEFCNAISKLEGLIPAYTINKSRSDPNNKSYYDNTRWLVTWNQKANGYRLPTEAEWEYACRAETTTPYNLGRRDIRSFLANFLENINDFRATTTAVGSFAPNSWGLYDMHGNVYEFCWDWYGPYQSGNQVNPIGAVSGVGHVLRGGSWKSVGKKLRSAHRHCDEPLALGGEYPFYSEFGIRLVRNAQ